MRQNRMQIHAALLVMAAIWAMPLGARGQDGAQALSVKTEDGVILKGAYSPPTKEGKPTVVLIHSAKGSRDSFGQFAGKLKAEGFGILVYDQRGHGQSTQTEGLGSINVDEFDQREDREKEYGKMVGDLDQVVTQFKKQTGTKDNQIVLMGAELGANVAINYASKNKDIGGVVLLSPAPDYRGVSSFGESEKLGNQKMLIAYGAGERRQIVGMSRRMYGLASEDVEKTETPPRETAEGELKPLTLVRSPTNEGGEKLLGGDTDKTIIDWIDRYGSESEESEQ